MSSIVQILVLSREPLEAWSRVVVQGADVAIERLSSEGSLSTLVRRLIAQYRGKTDALVFDASSDASLLSDLSTVLVEGIDAVTVFSVSPPLADGHSFFLPLQKDRFASHSGHLFQWDGLYALERFGSPFISRMNLSMFVKGRLGVKPPAFRAGPFEDGRFEFWPKDCLVGKGMKVSRTSEQVLNHLYNAFRGQAPLVIEPGFPIRVSASPSTFDALDGSRVTGLLASSVDEPGAYVVLTAEDLLEVAGYRRDDIPNDLDERSRWGLLARLLTVPFCGEVLTYLAEDLRAHPDR